MESPGSVYFPLNQPQACFGGCPTCLLLILIHTRFRSYGRRETIRETWAEKNSVENSVVVLFVVSEKLDKGDLPGYKNTLERESKLHQDIVLVESDQKEQFSHSFVPSDVWVRRYCPHVTYVLNIVDNSVVDLDKLVPFLKSFQSSKAPQLLCDYLMPNDSLVFNVNTKKHEGFCSSSAFISAPSVLGKLAHEVHRNQDSLKEAWLSEICQPAGIQISKNRKLFTGSRKKPSMLKDFMNSNYIESDVMVAVVRSNIPDRESILMRQTWQLIQSHRIQSFHKNQIMHNPPSESGSIIMFASILMLIDFSVIFFIFAFIFCKRRRKF